MKKTLRVEGLDCASCAAKMERAISALEGVTACSLSFLTGKLSLEAPEERMEAIGGEISKIVRKIEPGASVKL